MKTSPYLIALVLATTWLTPACSKNSGTTDSTTLPAQKGPPGSFSATINGVPWTATKVWSVAPKVIGISGYDEVSKIGINISIDKQNAVVGKVTVIEKDDVYQGVATYLNDSEGRPGDVTQSSTATITITHASDVLLEGTFSSRAGKHCEVTDGKFSVNLTRQY